MRPDEPALFEGKQAVDDRGRVSFVNSFSLERFVRFYVVENHPQGFIRAWHGHKQEAKAVTVTSGSALICAVRIDDWEAPSKRLEVSRFVLSENNPAVRLIPPGFANGFMTLTYGAKITFFPTSTVEESISDDFRYPAEY